MFRHSMLFFAVLAAGAAAEPPALSPPTLSPSERAARRFPQPVRVGDLLGRQVLRPVEEQTVLGRVRGVARRADGALLIVVGEGGVLGFGSRPVAVPAEAVALLGEYVALVGLSPEQLRALPTFESTGAAPVPANDTVRIGLVRPFH